MRVYLPMSEGQHPDLGGYTANLQSHGGIYFIFAEYSLVVYKGQGRMISQKLIKKTIKYFRKHQNNSFIVNPSLPILYFGDLDAYLKLEIRILTVGKNPSDNEFRLKKTDSYSFCRFSIWDVEKMNLIESLNPYFEKEPLKQWFSSFKPILNGLNCSYYQNENIKNIAIHTDICSPLATNPTWSKLTKDEQKILFEEGKNLERAN